MLILKKCILSVFVFAVAASSIVRAADIEIIKSGAGKSSIDLSSLQASGKAGRDFKATLENDLKLSGWFQIAAQGRGSIDVTGSALEGGGRVSASIIVTSRAGKRYLRENYGVSS